ncbi:MAG: oxygenase MpaB family protein [Acidimicrobiales bacterium]|nr:oxygenase MpaB family protein [Acidimicrobiales bacterium]
MISRLKDRVVGSTTSLFSHGPQPLEHTLSYAGDPGLLGPGSVSWQVIGDAAAFVGGIRALIVQTAHPEVVAGVEQHSRYKSDPLGRLSRTAVYVTETTYGAIPEVEAAVAAARQAHAPVRGHSERNKAYSAGHPAMAAWVHNVLTDSFLAAFQAYGPRTLTATEADCFVEEQTRIGALLDASPLPGSADELTRWISHHPELACSSAQAQAIEFLRNPPLPPPVRIGYRLLFNAAIATLPPSICDIVGLTPTTRGERVGRASVRSLRWALGSSPSWHLALVRTSAPVPPNLFRQPLPTNTPRVSHRNRRRTMPS